MFAKRNLMFIFTGLIAGALLVLGVRFLRYQPDEDIHYHANFAVYINGEREAFADPSYYEESGGALCSERTEKTPLSRVHIHDNVNDVVHVHDSAVTWGNFFQNLGWNVGMDFLSTDKELLVAGDQDRLVFILNGEEVTDVTRLVIGSRDKLLVSYGADQDAAEQYGSIAGTAEKYNQQKDPSGCGGSEEPSLRDRIKALF